MKVNPILDRNLNFYRFSHDLATESCHLDPVHPVALCMVRVMVAANWTLR
jgi:hypothetical protein